MDFLTELTVTALSYLAVAVLAALALPFLHGRGERWLPLQRLRKAAWSGGEVLLLMLIAVFLPALVLSLLDAAGFFRSIYGGDVSKPRQDNLATPLIVVLLLALQVTILHVISRTQAPQLGVSLARWRAHAALGILGFLIATPIVLLLHMAALGVFVRQPHQLEELAKEKIHFGEWAVLVLNALVLAPIVEEWLFRGLLQGWLRRASLLGHLVLVLAALSLGAGPTLKALARSQEDEAVVVPWGPLVLATLFAAAYVIGVLSIWRPVLTHGFAYFVDPPTVALLSQAEATPPSPGLPLPTLHGPRWEAFQQRNARWAIVGAAMLFALVHQDYWPAPIALFPLGLVLGWLAYRTQNLVPGMVLHALFNLVATVALIYGVCTGANGNNETTALRTESAAPIVSSVPVF